MFDVLLFPLRPPVGQELRNEYGLLEEDKKQHSLELLRW
jgi:hypothetical protein